MDLKIWKKKKDVMHQLATRKDVIDVIRAFNADLKPIKGYSKLSKDDLLKLTKQHKTDKGELVYMIVMEMVYKRYKEFIDTYEKPKVETAKPSPKKDTKTQPKPQPKAETKEEKPTQEVKIDNADLETAVLENLKVKTAMFQDEMPEYNIINAVLAIDKILKRNKSDDEKITALNADRERAMTKWLKRGEVISRGNTWLTVVNTTKNYDRFKQRVVDVLVYKFFNKIATAYGSTNFIMSFDAYKHELMNKANEYNYTRGLQFARPESYKRGFEAIYQKFVSDMKPAFIEYLQNNNELIEKMHSATKLYVKGKPWNLDR